MLKAATNPFFEVNFPKLMDASKVMTEFKVPNFGMQALMDMQRKNMEAVTAINQALIANLQSFVQRQAEMMRQGFEETTHLMTTVMSAPTPQEKVMRQAETSKILTEQCMTNIRDLTDSFAKGNTQTMETISNRMTDSVKELQGLMKTGVAA